MSKVAVLLSEREEDLLQAVFSFRFLTVKQVARLLFSASSKNYAGEYLKRLVDNNFLTRFPLPSSEKGNREYLYTLSRPGVKYVAGLGRDVSTWAKRTLIISSYQSLHHSLLVNDVLIAGRLLEKQHPDITLHTFMHEWYLKHTPLMVSVGDRRVGVVPDGFLDFRLQVRGTTYQTAVWLEVDNGTEDSKYIKQKIRVLYEVVTNKVYRDFFHTESMTLAFATTAGDKRRGLLRSWVEEELASLGARSLAEVFLFTCLSPAPDPVALFLSPCWVMPYQKQPLALLDVS